MTLGLSLLCPLSWDWAPPWTLTQPPPPKTPGLRGFSLSQSLCVRVLACPFGIFSDELASGWCGGLADHGGGPAGRLGRAPLPALTVATSCCHRVSLVVALLTHGGL